MDPKTPAGVTFFTDCIHCHETTGAITRQQFPVELPGHTVDTHRIVRDACGQCHKDPVPVIHARVAGGGQEWSGSHSGSSWSGHSTGGGTASASGEAAACFFCHVNNAQRAAVVQAGIAKGCAACSNCHGNR